MLDRSGDERAAVAGVGEILLHRDTFACATTLLNQRHGLIAGLAIVENDLGAGLAKEPHRLRPDATRTAADERHLSFKRKRNHRATLMESTALAQLLR